MKQKCNTFSNNDFLLALLAVGPSGVKLFRITWKLTPNLFVVREENLKCHFPNQLKEGNVKWIGLQQVHINCLRNGLEVGANPPEHSPDSTNFVLWFAFYTATPWFFGVPLKKSNRAKKNQLWSWSCVFKWIKKHLSFTNNSSRKWFVEISWFCRKSDIVWLWGGFHIDLHWNFICSRIVDHPCWCLKIYR